MLISNIYRWQVKWLLSTQRGAEPGISSYRNLMQSRGMKRKRIFDFRRFFDRLKVIEISFVMIGERD